LPSFYIERKQQGTVFGVVAWHFFWLQERLRGPQLVVVCGHFSWWLQKVSANIHFDGWVRFSEVRTNLILRSVLSSSLVGDDHSKSVPFRRYICIILFFVFNICVRTGMPFCSFWYFWSCWTLMFQMRTGWVRLWTILAWNGTRAGQMHSRQPSDEG
jgi:hypothetical protein